MKNKGLLRVPQRASAKELEQLDEILAKSSSGAGYYLYRLEPYENKKYWFQLGDKPLSSEEAVALQKEIMSENPTLPIVLVESKTTYRRVFS